MAGSNGLILLVWCGLIPIGVTAFYLSPLVVPMWRYGLKENPQMRMAFMSFTGLLTWFTFYAILTWLSVSLILLFSLPDPSQPDPQPELRPALTVELWQRRAWPVRSCYSPVEDLCALADVRLANSGAEASFTSIIPVVGVSLLLTLPQIGLFTYLTRPPKSWVTDQ